MEPSNENNELRIQANEVVTVGLFLERERKPVIIVSSFQVVFGLLCITIGAWMEIILDGSKETKPVLPVRSYAELWAGCLFVLTGSIGITSARKNRRGLIVGHIVLNVFMLPVSCVVIMFAVFNLRAPFYIDHLVGAIVCIASAMFITTMAGLIYDSKALCPCCRVCDYLSEIHEHLIANTVEQAMPEPVGGQTANVNRSLVYESDDNSIYEQISSRTRYATNDFLRENAQHAGGYVEVATQQADGEGYSYCTELPKRSLPSRPSATGLSKEPKPDKMDSPTELTSADYIDVICD